MPNVRVVARIRPPLPRECESTGFVRCVGLLPGETGARELLVTTTDTPVLVDIGGGVQQGLRRFTLDDVFDEGESTVDVYSRCCRAAVQNVLGGVNATILCYGQTGSGKTHTMLGDGEQEGLVAMAARDILDAATASGGSVELAFVELYGSKFRDLLAKREASGGQELRLRETDMGEVFIEGLSREPVGSCSEVAELLKAGTRRRRVASTALNQTSSRSHAIATFRVTMPASADGTDGGAAEANEALCAKLHLVDLAGSERVKDSRASGVTLREATHINLSLFHLARVVLALRDGAAIVPYKDAALCSLLRDALGGNCATTLLATVSPAQRHALETASTLSFASACAHVETHARVNRVGERGRPWAPPTARRPLAGARKRQSELREAAQNASQLPWSHAVRGGEGCPGGRISMRTAAGSELSCLAFGEVASGRLAVCLHGYPSAAQSCYGDWLIEALVHAGFYVLAPDMPGCGHSQGAPLRTRSEHNLKEGGAAELVGALIRASGHRHATLIGSDWGGGIALSMATSPTYRALIGAVVVMHPSYGEVARDELRRVRCPTLVLWCKEDAFHSYKAWKPLITKMHESLGDGKFRQHLATRSTDAAWTHAERERAIIKFLTGVDPLPTSTTVVVERPQEASVRTDGTLTVAAQNVVLHTEALDPRVTRAVDPEAEAVTRFAAAWREGRLAQLYRDCVGPSGASKQAASRLFGSLPQVGPLAHPGQLQSCGLWSGAAAQVSSDLLAAAEAQPRFFVGRHLLLPAEELGELAGWDAESGTVWARVRGELRRFGAADVASLNQPHQLPLVAGELRLEQGSRLYLPHSAYTFVCLAYTCHTCHTLAIHLPYTCHTLAIHLPYTCHTLAIRILLTPLTFSLLIL